MKEMPALGTRGASKHAEEHVIARSSVSRRILEMVKCYIKILVCIFPDYSNHYQLEQINEGPNYVLHFNMPGSTNSYGRGQTADWMQFPPNFKCGFLWRLLKCRNDVLQFEMRRWEEVCRQNSKNGREADKPIRCMPQEVK